MKLLSLKVQNFGTLENFSLDFFDGLNTIKEENGFGKSTLAAFIKAMFYSFSGKNTQSLETNERKKYSPWQGGVFGGSLDFETNGKKYRIERFFGQKDKDDTFRLLDLDKGTESNDFSENIGEELFSINAEGLTRSIYMPQMQLDLSMNTSLSAKLTGLLEDSNDLNNFDNAIKKLNSRRTYYAAQKGNKGFIADLENKYSETERKISEAKSANETLEKLELLESQAVIKNEELLKKLEVVREKIALAASREAIASDLKRQEELSTEIAEIESSIKELDAKYKNGFPSIEETDNISKLGTSYNELLSKNDVLLSQTADSNKLKTLKEKYSVVPSLQDLFNIKEKVETISASELKLSALGVRADKKQNSKLPTVLFVLAAIAIALGVGGLFVSLVAGIILLVLGLVSAMAGSFLLLKNMISNGSESGLSKADYAKEQAKIALMEQELQALLDKFSLKNDISSKELDSIIYDVREIERLEAEEETRLLAIKANDEQAKGLRAKLDRFFVFVLGNEVLNVAESVGNIRNDKNRFDELKSKLLEKTEKLAAVPKNVLPADLDSVSTEELKENEKQISNELNEASKLITEYASRISVAEPIALALGDLEAELEGIKTEIATAKDRLFAIDKAIELLKTAKTNLSSRYITVMRERMKEYSKLVYGEDIGEMLLDDSLSLELSREGAARDKDYFSSGYKDMLNICMRLSLADALYDNEKPMLILDDPFVNLDDDRLINAMELLKKLADERQIIYLTCHSSRVL